MHASSPRPDSAPAPSRRAVWGGAAIILLAALAAYHNCFSGELVYDDLNWVIDNRAIRHFWPPGPWLFPPAGSDVGGRPLASFTFALNYALGGLSVGGYHAVNLALHVLAALVLFGLVRRTLLLPPLRERFAGAALPLAVVVAGLWAVHPLASEVVDYISQRTESLMAVCYLLTLYAFARGSVRSSRRWYPLCVAACALGMASKEDMVTAPLMVLLYDRTFVAGSFAAAWRQRWRLYVALAATWIVLGLLMVGLGHRSVGYHLGVSGTDYALTQCRAIVTYLRLAVWPHPLIFDRGKFLAHRFAEVWPYAVLLAVLLAGTLAAWRRRPALGFAGCWVFIILAPSSSVVPIVEQPIAENRMYLPLAAIMALAVLGLYALTGRRSLAGFVVLALGLGFLTVRRNEVYRSGVSLWADTAAQCPANGRAHYNLGVALDHAGRSAEAIAHYREALRLNPNDDRANNNLGNALLGAGQVTEAIAFYHRALRVTPDDPEMHNNLGNALLEAGQTAAAAAQIEIALRLKPDYATAHFNLGNVHLQTGRNEEAILQYEEALHLGYDDAKVHCNLGLALTRTGRMTEAIREFQEALRRRPELVEARNDLAVALYQAGRIDDAIHQFEEILRQHPDLAAVRGNLEQLLQYRQRLRAGR